MEKEQAIDYLENLQEGKFITVNIPIYKETKVQVTAMYVGKDADPQANLTTYMGYYDEDNIPETLSTLIEGYINDEEIKVETGVSIFISKRNGGGGTHIK